MSYWLLFTVNSAIFHLCHRENKLHVDEMIMMYANSLKQQFAGRHLDPLGQIILVPCQPVAFVFINLFSFTWYFSYNKFNQSNKFVGVFDWLVGWGLTPTCWSVHINTMTRGTTDPVSERFEDPPRCNQKSYIDDHSIHWHKVPNYM